MERAPVLPGDEAVRLCGIGIPVFQRVAGTDKATPEIPAPMTSPVFPGIALLPMMRRISGW